MFAKGDIQILKHLWDNRLLTAEDLVILTGRQVAGRNDPQIIRRRMRALQELGFADCHAIESDTNPLIGRKIWYLTQKGLDYGYDEFGVGDGNTIIRPRRGRSTITHDYQVVRIRLAILSSQKAAWTKIHEHQLEDGVKPDLGYALQVDGDLAGFLHEHERSNASKSRETETMSDLDKAERYLEYFKTNRFKKLHPDLDNFRVSWTFKTWEKAQNFAGRLKAQGGDFNDWRFWITSYDKLVSEPSGKIFLAPPDFQKGELYSFSDA